MKATSERQVSRLYGSVALHGSVLECGGQRFEPDEGSAYVEFRLAHGFPVVSAYGTAVHPGTIANSWRSLVGKPLNFNHQMRANDRSKDKDEIRRDYVLGAVMAAEYPTTPFGGWKVGSDAAASPGIRAVGVIHKLAEKVPQILGEHLGGRHRWTVSMEMGWNMAESGFIVGTPDKARGKVASLLKETTPEEFSALGYGYVPAVHAPDELLGCWNYDKHCVGGAWEGLPVRVLMNGVGGQTQFAGVGLVRYGAEREAEIQQILATDPDRLTLENWDADYAGLVTYFEGLKKNTEKLLTALSKSA